LPCKEFRYEFSAYEFFLVISYISLLCWELGWDFKHSLTYFSALGERTPALSSFSVFSTLRIDETLASIILQSIKERGMGGREKGSKSKSEAQKPNLGHKEAREQIMLQATWRPENLYWLLSPQAYLH
jgi:hypothetical protein